MPTVMNEIQQALGDSAADFQAVWESSADMKRKAANLVLLI